MELLIHVFYWTDLLILLFLGSSALYFMFFAVLALFYREEKAKIKQGNYLVELLIPAYKEDAVIIQTAIACKNHVSQKAKIGVNIIADQLKPQTIAALEKIGIQVYIANFEHSTKVKSLQLAMNKLPKNTDLVIVLDADNLLKTNFVDASIERIEQGYSIVQGRRVAKNANTTFAVLDGISEEINNSIFRKGHRVAQLSSSIIGSGFTCDYSLFKTLINQMRAVGGFDKELELLLIGQKISIGFANAAVVYDEKIQQEKAFVNQRRRWLSAQFVYLRNNFRQGFFQLFGKGNIDFADKLIQFLVLPRILTLGLISMAFLGHVFLLLINATVSLQSLTILWGIALGLTILALLLATPRYLYRKKTFQSLWALPKGFVLMFIALLSIKGANKNFIHTQHGF